MLQWVLKQHGQIVPRTTMHKLNPDELLCASEINKREVFDSAIKKRYGDSFTLPERIKNKSDDPQDDYGTFELPFDEVTPDISEADITDAEGNPLHTSYAADILINAEVLLPQGEDMRLTTVIRSNVNTDGKVIGYYNKIPTLKAILYDTQFPDGAIKPYSSNLIAENILMQVDAD